ncbi:MAG: DUF2723 domain-containing protein [Bacteroidetes bacterium]|nr:DUF2723 domain-containing protein [Bacteroidota bacterium]
MNFKNLNNIGGWLVFAISLVTYTLTVEPTASFWDCGEFIACSYKLQVPHPAGAPFFLLLGRIASMFAGADVSNVAFMVNMVSVLASAFTILFMFWTISLLGRKIVGQSADTIDSENTIKVLGAALVGSLVYTFSESFWFSAVEAEVYGLSSFFTAIVVWAAFRWELIEDPAKQNKWLIFVAYLVGLSIGVHLLNLVTLPALAILYYFKKTKKIELKGAFMAFLGGLIILAVIMVGLITGLPTLSFSFDKIFVNTFGLPFASGMIFFILLLIGGLAYGIYYSQKHGKATLNTILLAFSFVLIGYSTYTIALIRSNYNPPINENNPSDVLNFTYYLKREQYGSRPLLYGPIYTAQLQAIERGEPNYKVGKDKYETYDYSPEYVWDPNGKMLLPRVWSQDPNHMSLYRSKLNLAEGQRPSLFKNLEFMFTHQFGHMYWRYFIWNFWGRASDISDAAATNIFENKKDLPSLYAQNKGRTNYYALPLILGILGFLYMYFKRDKDAIVMFLLFFFTGLGLVIYLNSPPVEPRERDYIYVGSFYFFAIWIGVGVMAIADYVLKFIKNGVAKAGVATVIALFVPVLMAKQAWAGHDRSDRYHQVDFARNLLNSCEKNAILFTGGDNDTFPLWYAQEVEGVRTDVRVCNLSLLGTDWYIEQMKRKTYESEALPISLETDNYYKGINDQIPFVENSNPQIQAGINLKEFLKLVKSNDPAIQMQVSSGDLINVLPSPNFYLDMNAEEVAGMSFVPQNYKSLVKDRMEWNFGKRDILKNDLVVLDIIAQNNWKRPIYFSGTLAPNSYLNLKEFCQLEGYAYRLMPFKVAGAKDGFVNPEVMEKNINRMQWRNLNNEKVYYDSETYLKVPIVTARFAFLRLVDQLVREGKKAEAEKYLDKSLEVMPDKTIPFDQLVGNYPIFYYEIGKVEKARKIADIMVNRADEELKYFIEKNRSSNDRQWGDGNIQQIIQSDMRTIQMLYSAAEQYDKPQADKYKKIYETHLAKIQ